MPDSMRIAAVCLDLQGTGDSSHKAFFPAWVSDFVCSADVTFSVFDAFSPLVLLSSYINRTGIECRYGKYCRIGVDTALAFRCSVFGEW